MKPALDYVLAVAAFVATGLAAGTDIHRPALVSGSARGPGAEAPPAVPAPAVPETPRDLSAPDRDATRGGADPASAAPAGEPRAPLPGAGAAQDRAFVEAAAQFGQQEIVDTRAALQRASRPSVREAAEVMLAEHTEAYRRLRSVASRKGWSMPENPPAPTPIDAADFDHAFAEQQVRAHERSLALFRAQSEAGGDPELRTFARAAVPTLEHHLELARALRQDTAPRGADRDPVRR